MTKDIVFASSGKEEIWYGAVSDCKAICVGSPQTDIKCPFYNDDTAFFILLATSLVALFP